LAPFLTPFCFVLGAPVPGMDEFLTMSDTPIYTRTTDYANNLTSEDMAKINRDFAVEAAAMLMS